MLLHQTWKVLSEGLGVCVWRGVLGVCVRVGVGVYVCGCMCVWCMCMVSFLFSQELQFYLLQLVQAIRYDSPVSIAELTAVDEEGQLQLFVDDAQYNGVCMCLVDTLYTHTPHTHTPHAHTPQVRSLLKCSVGYALMHTYIRRYIRMYFNARSPLHP